MMYSNFDMNIDLTYCTGDFECNLGVSTYIGLHIAIIIPRARNIAAINEPRQETINGLDPRHYLLINDKGKAPPISCAFPNRVILIIETINFDRERKKTYLDRSIYQ